MTAFEVLEHIDNFEHVLEELFRVTHRQLILSVPDIEAVPLLSTNNVVPWHLLESTHINFFTLRSLKKQLAPHCADIQFHKIHPTHINGVVVYASLVAVCHKKKPTL